MINKKKTYAVIFAVLTLLITLFIFSNSLKDGVNSAKQSDFAVDIINNLLDFFGISADVYTLGVIIRKLAHFLEYFVLGLTSCIFLSGFKNKVWLAVSPIYCLAVAICDEFVMQAATSGRAPQWTDVLIDLCGALFALGIIAVIRIYKEKRV